MDGNNVAAHRSRSQRLRRTGFTLGVASLFLLIGTTACQAATAQSAFDQAAGRFAACPDSPNCVSTQAPADDSEHTIAPLSYTGSVAEAREQLLAVINAQPRTTLVTDQAVAGGHYFHV
ncbi:MAG: DUF1499 domain-containing protein [Caldilineaceae bacterium]|nr:DUF1499 domain-containing protein [Caldilineaceae bacterium]